MRDQSEWPGLGQKNYTLPGPEPGPKNNYRDQRLNPRLYDGLNSVNFCTSEVTLFAKNEPKSASRRRLNKLKKRNFLDEILNYRTAGPLSVLVPATGTGTKKSWSRTSLVGIYLCLRGNLVLTSLSFICV